MNIIDRYCKFDKVAFEINLLRFKWGSITIIKVIIIIITLIIANIKQIPLRNKFSASFQPFFSY